MDTYAVIMGGREVDRNRPGVATAYHAGVRTDRKSVV